MPGRTTLDPLMIGRWWMAVGEYNYMVDGRASERAQAPRHTTTAVYIIYLPTDQNYIVSWNNQDGQQNYSKRPRTD